MSKWEQVIAVIAAIAVFLGFSRFADGVTEKDREEREREKDDE